LDGTRSRRSALAVDAERRWVERRARIATDIRTMRRRRRWTQADLAGRSGVHRLVVARLERGTGRVDLELLERIGLALGVPLSVGFDRDRREEIADAGHLAMQELVLRTARAAGFGVAFELPTRPTEPSRSADVAVGSDSQRVAIDVECWNTFGDVGASVRSSNRKQVELGELAVARWGADGRAALVWAVRDTDRNHRLVRRYPEVFRSRFPASSRAWVDALTRGTAVPAEAGLIWCDLARGRLHAWRRETPGG
jgi:transcriptional regulator with XRE-family HTH domain